MIPAGAAALELIEWSDGRRGDLVKHTLAVLVENKPGALMRIASMFARRGYNIDSLAVGPTERHDVSRVTIRVDCEQHPLEQIEKQMHKLVNVLRVAELVPGESIERELALIKVDRAARAARRAARARRRLPRTRRRPRARGARLRGRRLARGDRLVRGARPAARRQGARPHRPHRPHPRVRPQGHQAPPTRPATKKGSHAWRQFTATATSACSPARWP